jgi:uncharacterized integral membrane protein
MTLAFKQMRVCVRAALVIGVVGAIGLVLLMNRTHTVSFWFFGLTPDHPIHVVWLMLCTAGGTLLAWWTVLVALRLYRDMRELKQSRTLESAVRSQSQRSAELDERERRLDEKLKRAIADVEEEEER